MRLRDLTSAIRGAIVCDSTPQFFHLFFDGPIVAMRMVPGSDAWVRRSLLWKGMARRRSRQRALLDQFSRCRVIDFARQYFDV
jgi:hypothetical protein